MREETKVVLAAIAPVMKRNGFMRRGANWYLKGPETLAMLNVQVSQWGSQCFINLAVLINDIDRIYWPKQYQCHLRLRLEDLAPDRPRIQELCIYGRAGFEAGVRELVDAIVAYGIPHLRRCMTVDGVREVLRDTPKFQYHATGSLLKRLGIPIPPRVNIITST